MITERKVRPVTVLLAGMNYMDNQLTRGLRRYPNVTVLWHKPDPGKAFRTDCDAAVIPIGHCSHQSYYDVKEAYKGRPIFVCREGFSEIKERFEKWLDGLPVEMETPPEIAREIAPPPQAGSMHHAFQAAMKRIEIESNETTKTETKEEETMKKERKKPDENTDFARRVRWTNNYIWTSHAKGMKPKEIAQEINRLGYRTRNDNRWNNIRVNQVFHSLQKANFVADPQVLLDGPPQIQGMKQIAKERHVVETSGPMPNPPKRVHTITAAPTTNKSDATALASMIIDANLTKEQKLEMLKVIL